MWDKFTEFFSGVWTAVFGETPKETLDRAANVASDEIAGFARVALAAGVKEGGALFLAFKDANAQAQAQGGSGTDKKATFTALAATAWQQFGGDVEHEAFAAAIDFGSTFFHMKDKADEIGAPRV